jgi:hypothetical protein
LPRNYLDRENRRVRTGSSTVGPYPSLSREKKGVVGEIRTSALPSTDNLGIAFNRGRIIRVRRKYVYCCLRERNEARVLVPWKNRRIRESHESCNEGGCPEKHRCKRTVVFKLKRKASVDNQNQGPACFAECSMLRLERGRSIYIVQQCPGWKTVMS